MGPIKILSFIAYLFTFIGMLGLIGTGFGYFSTKDFLSRATPAEGTVINLIEKSSSSNSGGPSTHLYTPVVRFKSIQGEEWQFTASVSSYPPAHRVGEKVFVLYIPGQEEDAKINTFRSLWLLHFIFGGLGFVFFTIGISLLTVRFLKESKEKKLRNQGIPIQVEFQGVERNTQITINDRNPFRLIAQWQDPATSKLHLFESANIWFDPSPFISKRQLTVFIDPNNPRRYHLDISFLPELAE
ncbi:MAG: DUF3592 domain-containing protein [Burkholderiaceae bacterium]|nr:DUF3592 domain-containing protein [Burkholderiaceae bacterium]